MHIPDGFLGAKVAVLAGAASLAGLGAALAVVRRQMPAQRVPLIGLAAAFVFAAQMVNFPVAGGTSGHLIGGVLAAAFLGPSAAVLVMTAVVILQCLAFADGGVTALGANLFNMAVAAPLAGWAVYAAVRRLAGGGLRASLLGGAFAAWCSVLLAAVLAAAELALSGTAPWSLVFPAMAGIHMIIGAGEAVITALVMAAVARTRPDLLDLESTERFRPVAAYGLLAALGAAALLAPLASPLPDGLEWTAGKLGFSAAAESSAFSSPLSDYTVPGIRPGAGATVAAALIGTAAAFGLALVLAGALTRRPSAAAGPRGSPR
jgi:cobalt/nickel transport system permease protein